MRIACGSGACKEFMCSHVRTPTDGIGINSHTGLLQTFEITCFQYVRHFTSLQYCPNCITQHRQSHCSRASCFQMQSKMRKYRPEPQQTTQIICSTQRWDFKPCALAAFLDARTSLAGKPMSVIAVDGCWAEILSTLCKPISCYPRLGNCRHRASKSSDAHTTRVDLRQIHDPAP